MTIFEFRLFFDSLPDKLGADQTLPTKWTFALECDMQLTYLKEMVSGKKSFTEFSVNKLLPVMRKYGFQG